MQPESNLGEFDGQRVLVDAVDAALQHHAADNVAVLEMLGDIRPIVLVRMVDDLLAHLCNLVRELGFVVGPGDDAFRFGNGRKHFIG